MGQGHRVALPDLAILAGGLALAAVSGGVAWGFSPKGGGDRLTSLLAYLGVVYLSITLCVGPAAALGSAAARRALRHRRWMGLTSFCVILVHVACVWHFWYGWSFRRGFDSPARFVVFHAAFLVILLLAATSNDWSERRLGRWWKRLHRLIVPVYLILGYAGLRITLTRPGWRWLAGPFALVCLGTILLRVAAIWKRLSERQAAS